MKAKRKYVKMLRENCMEIYNMGDIIKNLNGRVPSIFIERKIDDIETQKLRFHLTKEAWLSTETENSIRLFGRDEDYNTIEVEIPISITELKDALEKFLH